MQKADNIPELDASGLRRFALTTGGGIGVLFGLVLPWIFDLVLPLWPWVACLFLVLWGLVLPRSMGGFYRLWMRLAFMLNKITSPIILSSVFFLVLLPTGLIMRWFGRRDPLHRDLDPEVESYRDVHGDDAHSDLRNPF